ncbi:MAG: NTP transferase domain-containing protein [Armatimonadetes bacterium]|nr:NTP transferase domain-containing protein [Armatimonadota bacterium]NIM24890.1 NTP transferase domain-containing protein [Armatimonadota bacterium]NIM68779.1 NTP transferase domain-containing protein [Armatimonadota bacterium]NIM77041.1 NTP transferase domain-containing protein [Armatimonadota bacterium]NIN06976.1 NTP transferase domain-containing protein [Armatimonadota bacterium]
MDTQICYTQGVSAIILAGGRSERIGCPKADLKLGERSLLEWVTGALQGLFNELIIVAPVAPQTMPQEARLVVDEPAGCGPLGGLYAGLKAARDDVSFAAGCDTPFLRPALVKGLLGMAEGYDAVVPKLEDGLHPLCGIYSRACVEKIRQALESGNRRVASFFPSVKVRFVNTEELRRFDPEPISFFNINTSEDLAAAECLQEKLSTSQT